MTLTINRERYAELLSLYQPRVIKTEEENESFLAIVEELMARPQLTPEEEAILELLVRLIEEFEEEHYPIAASTPHSRLLHLMEARSLDSADLGVVLGSVEVAKLGA
jgi:HTH-type transcriptional regulator / antitoxin HigA